MVDKNNQNEMDQALLTMQGACQSLLNAMASSQQMMPFFQANIQAFNGMMQSFIEQGEHFAIVQKSFFDQSVEMLYAGLRDYAATEPSKTTVHSEASKDRRFSGEAWSQAHYDSISQAYLLYCHFVMRCFDAMDVSERDRARLQFMTKQYLDAVSPSNFTATNPDVMREAFETKGASLTKGIANLLSDLEKGRLSQTDEAVFKLGVNLACTEGDVVFRNDLIELIQYTPSTPTVFERPLLIVPPCINKYYILDLSESNSFVRYLVSQGHTVFMISWRNPDEAMCHFTWDDYVVDGVFAAIDAVAARGEQVELNALGFCIGGTLLATALAILAKRGDSRVASATFLATMLDFSDTGDLGLFVDEAAIRMRERLIGKGGIVPAAEFAITFSALRANELIWPYVVDNYLKGRKPASFDILYWNSDSTNLTGPMSCWYLRNTYLENRLRLAGGSVVCAQPLDLGLIRVPVYCLAAERDHIVPWRTAFYSRKVMNAPVRFVLAEAGHIAGVVNPPDPVRRGFKVNEQDSFSSPEEWLAHASAHQGSWWPDWTNWLKAYAGSMVKSRKVKASASLCKAPGTYIFSSH